MDRHHKLLKIICRIQEKITNEVGCSRQCYLVRTVHWNVVCNVIRSRLSAIHRLNDITDRAIHLHHDNNALAVTLRTTLTVNSCTKLNVIKSCAPFAWETVAFRYRTMSILIARDIIGCIGLCPTAAGIAFNITVMYGYKSTKH